MTFTTNCETLFKFSSNYSKNKNMCIAARGGHKYLVEFFISKGANEFDWGMYSAAQGGHQDLVDFFKLKIEKN